ncbi:SRPBCC family protein [Streptomyces prasinus]|uniref:SRPBCC family protein n=1 Tax=Streptomyces prasinus TaxID=67345 RepID=UPI0033BCA831
MKTDTRSTSRLRHDPLVRGLGWASALLGVPQVAAPAGFARALGVDDTSRHRSATTAVGVRELAAATGLLGRPHPAWLWGRVGGDLMDLTMLTRALKNHNGRGLGRTVAATAAVTAITATDVYAAVTRTRRSAPMELTAAITVTQPPDEVYGLWSDLERLPDFMAHLDEVRVTGPRTSHWRAGAPFGKVVEWDAETTQDVPGQLIAWRSADGADIDNSGEVRFVPAPGGRGTEIRVTLRYDLPGGALSKTAARYFGEEPHQQLDDDLRRFKQIAETGEVVRSEGAPGGKRARGEFPQHPARPLTEDELKEALA